MLNEREESVVECVVCFAVLVSWGCPGRECCVE